MAKGKYIRTDQHRIMFSENMKKAKRSSPTPKQLLNASLRMRGNKNFLGKKHTQETKDKLSALKKGVPRSKETVEQMLKTRRERYPDMLPPMLGKRHSDETKKKLSIAHTGKKMTVDQRKKISIGAKRGEKHYNWKGGRSSESETIRKSLEYRLWRESVFFRDNFTCRFCQKRGGELNADHIKPFALFPELRFAIDNGRTLCAPCHRKTDTWGSVRTKN